ncbi:MAG: hypothetical protein NPINA01_25970 [Nitrospinaceae bacterium]|nr:MAG: hypothetical protein NPINA01_25970 [Nitrospinaceae bacterium]
MKKSIFVLTTFLLAFSFYIFSPANLVLADKGHGVSDVELIQDDQIPTDTNHSEIYPEDDVASRLPDEIRDDTLDDITDDTDDALNQEDDLLNSLSFEGSDDEKEEGVESMN